MSGKVLFLLLLPLLWQSVLAASGLLFNEFQHFATRSWSSAEGLSHDHLTSFYMDPDGLVWVGTIEGLNRIDAASVKVFKLSEFPGLQSNKINDISGSGGSVYVATDNGISVVRDEGRSIGHILTQSGFFDVEAISETHLFATDGTEIFEIKSNKINKLSDYALFPNGGVKAIYALGDSLGILDRGGRFFVYSSGVFSRKCGALDVAFSAAKGRSGRLFLAAENGVIYEVRGETCEAAASLEPAAVISDFDFHDGTFAVVSNGKVNIVNVMGAKTEERAIPGQTSFFKVFFENGSSLWQLSDSTLSHRYRTQFVTLGRDAGLAVPTVYSMLEDRDGTVWLGTRGGGLFSYREGRFQPLREGMDQVAVGGMMLEESGKILVGTSDGLFRFDPENPADLEPQLDSKGGRIPLVSVIFRDSSKRLWAGTGNGGIYLFKDGMWQFLRNVAPSGEGYISAISETPDGDLLFASSNGLIKFDKEEKFSDFGNLSDLQPLSVYAGEDGDILVGTMRRGITLVSKKYGNVQLDSMRGLCSDTIFAILRHGDKYWFTSTNGIFALSVSDLMRAASDPAEKLECTRFDSRDGIRSLESTGGVQPAVLMRSNGDIWFPTVGGVVVLAEGAGPSAKFSALAKPALSGKAGEDGGESPLQNIFFSILKIFAIVALLAFGGAVLRRNRGGSKPSEEPAVTPEEPADTPEEPAVTPEEPAVTPEEPADTLEEPAVTPEELSETSEEPAVTPEEPSGTTEESADTLEDDESDGGDFDFDDTPDEPQPVKYEKSRLDDHILAAYAEELMQLMDSQKPYRNPDLTLGELAQAIGLTTNILSQVINSHFKQNFYAFVSHYRLKETLELMNMPENAGKNILELAFTAGFNSKTTFNATFKKELGETPRNYRKRIAK